MMVVLEEKSWSPVKSSAEKSAATRGIATECCSEVAQHSNGATLRKGKWPTSLLSSLKLGLTHTCPFTQGIVTSVFSQTNHHCVIHVPMCFAQMQQIISGGFRNVHWPVISKNIESTEIFTFWALHSILIRNLPIQKHIAKTSYFAFRNIL